MSRFPLFRRTLLAVAVLAACASHDTGRRSARDDLGAAASGALRVFATGDTRGFLEPCGCEEGQFGGIARRGTYRRGSAGAGDVWIDLGNLTSGGDELRRLRREAALDAFAQLRYDAVVPGRAEIADGEAFETAARARGLPVVSANVVGADGALVFEPWTLRDVSPGRRVAIVGLTDPGARSPSGRKVVAPEGALRRAVGDLAGKADVVIAATSLDVPAARALADAVPGVALVLSGSTPEPDAPFETRTSSAGGTVVVAAVGHLGEYVARVDFDASLRPAMTWRAWLDDQVADDPELAAVTRRYRDAAAALDERMVEKLAEGHRASGFAGSLSCAPCHRAEFDVWKASRHATAMRSLVAKKTNRDPDCVPCHLVDVPERPAPAPWDPDAHGVGCEACHGPSAAHAADPEVKTPVRDGGRSVCASQCHHPPEVKHFDLALHWPRIAHGGK
jgi:2',3'-cyclic-nucleotide 2'-phosphodiesterase (5'-nucleotidase family)